MSVCVYIILVIPPLCTAPDDYTAISSQPVTFSSAPDQMCSPVSISSDTVVEATESFAVILESTDPVVQVTQQFASVIIIDSEPSSKYTQSGYFVGGWRICLCVIAFVSAMHAVHSCTTLDRDNSPPHPY